VIEWSAKRKKTRNHAIALMAVQKMEFAVSASEVTEKTTNCQLAISQKKQKKSKIEALKHSLKTTKTENKIKTKKI